MQKLRLYTGKLGESIDDALPAALEEAKRENETVYLLWNGVLLSVTPDSTKDECLAEFHELHLKEYAWQRYKKGEFVSCDALAQKLASFIKGLFFTKEL